MTSASSSYSSHRFIVTAAISALLAVAMGAFGAHGLRGQISEASLAVYRTAVEYQMWHSLGLGLIGTLIERHPDSPKLRWAAWAMMAGIVLFSGSLYVLSLTGLRWLGMITPLGGLSFMLGWALLAFAMSRNKA